MAPIRITRRRPQHHQHKAAKLSPEELAEILEAIAESEEEDRQGVVITHEDIKKMVAGMIADYKAQKLSQIYQPSEAELAALKERIRATEEKLGIPHEQALAEFDRFYQSLKNKQGL